MRWERRYAQLTSASPSAVWERWSTPAFWSEDDPGLERATFETPIRVGGTGFVTDVGSPRQRFRFTVVEPERAMDIAIRLPGGTLSVVHLMERTEHGLRVEHGVRIDGPLAPVYVALVGRTIARGLPGVVRTVTANALNASAGRPS